MATVNCWKVPMVIDEPGIAPGQTRNAGVSFQESARASFGTITLSAAYPSATDNTMMTITATTVKTWGGNFSTDVFYQIRNDSDLGRNLDAWNLYITLVQP